MKFVGIRRTANRLESSKVQDRLNANDCANVSSRSISGNAECRSHISTKKFACSRNCVGEETIAVGVLVHPPDSSLRIMQRCRI